MGIDIYLKWKEQSREDHEKQMTGFSTVAGNVGYLREAYHGGPYATRVLMPEAFADEVPDEGATIPNSVLVERLELTEATVRERYAAIYSEKDPAVVDPAVKAYHDFVALHGQKEKAGLEPTIYASY